MKKIEINEINLFNKNELKIDLKINNINLSINYLYTQLDNNLNLNKNIDGIICALFPVMLLNNIVVKSKYDVSEKLLCNLHYIYLFWKKNYNIELKEDFNQYFILNKIKRHASSNSCTIQSFTNGIDSSHTFSKNKNKIDYILNVYGMDCNNHKINDVIKSNMRKIAKHYNKKCIFVESNVRKILYKIYNLTSLPGKNINLWGQYIHAGAIFSTIYNIESNIIFYFPSSPNQNITILNNKWGSNFIEDKYYSSEKVSIIHDSPFTLKSQKVKFICKYDNILIDTLRVCWSSNKEYNCGRCEKCLRSMLLLYINGKTNNDILRIFKHTFKPEMYINNSKRFDTLIKLYDIYDNCYRKNKIDILNKIKISNIPKRNVCICDIDMTICDSYHRAVIKKDISTTSILSDNYLPKALESILLLSQKYEVHFCTCRGFLKNAKEITETWLAKHGFVYNRLIIFDNMDQKIDYAKKINSKMFIDDLESQYKPNNIVQSYIKKLKLSDIPFIKFESWIDTMQKLQLNLPSVNI